MTDLNIKSAQFKSWQILEDLTKESCVTVEVVTPLTVKNCVQHHSSEKKEPRMADNSTEQGALWIYWI